MLLAPKPRPLKSGRSQAIHLQGSDVRGRTKYAPLNEFDSVQDLATLGSLVPLIYTKTGNQATAAFASTHR